MQLTGPPSFSIRISIRLWQTRSGQSHQILAQRRDPRTGNANIFQNPFFATLSSAPFLALVS